MGCLFMRVKRPSQPKRSDSAHGRRERDGRVRRAWLALQPLRKWSNDSRNWKCIIIGDFNANHLLKNKCKILFTQLETLSLNSLLQFYNIIVPTQQRGYLSSQIDYIWTTSELTLDIEIPELIDPYNIIDSNHYIIATTWYTNFTPKQKRQKKHKHKFYNYDKVMKEQWEEFRTLISNEMQEKFSNETITNMTVLNKL